MTARDETQIKHGRTGYTHHGCRCDVCRTATRDYQAAHRRTNSGSTAVRVRALAQANLLKLVINETPDLWRGILDDAWIELTGHPARPAGRPKVSS